jgi:hypothetical protein
VVAVVVEDITEIVFVMFEHLTGFAPVVAQVLTAAVLGLVEDFTEVVAVVV